MGGPAAAPHVDPSHRKAGFKAGLRQAPHVSRFSRPLKSVHHDDLTTGGTIGALRLHQHLDAGLGRVELRCHWITRLVERARPKISSDSEDVVVGDDRVERTQPYILRGCARLGLGSALALPLDGKEDLKGGAASGRARYGDAAAMSAYDSQDGCQSEAAASEASGEE